MAGVEEAGGGRGELSGSYQAQAQQPRRQTVPWGQPVNPNVWVAACRSKWSFETCCLPCPRPACQTQCSGCIKIRGAGSLGLDKWATRAHGAQNIICLVTVAAQCSQASPRALGPSIVETPLWIRALSLSLSLPASTSDCSSLFISLSLSTRSGRNPVQKLNAHLTAAHPHPLGGARQRAQRSRPSQVRPVRNQVSQSLRVRGAEGTRRRQGDGKGRRPPRPVMG